MPEGAAVTKDRDQIPVTVIGGYLGSGKTTLLNHLIRQNQGRRIAVLVNDFGAINIDVQLIASHDGDTISLTNGCICCSLAAGLHTVMNSLLERDLPPEHIIVEASGVALPHVIGQYGHMPGFRLNGVVVLVDAETIRSRVRDTYVGKTVLHQLSGADLLVLTKTDLIPEEASTAVRAWLRAISANTRIVAADHGDLPPAVVLGMSSDGSERGNGADSSQEEGHAVDYDTTSLHLRHQIDEDALRAAIAELPEGILRGKGIVWLAGDPERQTIFQLVGKRWSIKQGEPWSDRRPAGTELVFIGLPGSLEGVQLAPLFSAPSSAEVPVNLESHDRLPASSRGPD